MPEADAPPLFAVESADAALFASDMHLDDGDPALTARFLAELDRRLAGAGSPSTLFLLGDLFEFWIGDDRLSAPGLALASRLAALVADGGRVCLMHGNRDFLIDASLPADPGRQLRYSDRCGALLLPDPAVVLIDGTRVVLSHGDALCTDDVGYQQWRTLCRSAAWQRDFLARPVAERHAMAIALRERSKAAQQGRPSLDTAGDVAPDAVDALLDAHRSDLLVHGHTHRPALHRWRHGGQPRQRWVLSDWSAGAADARGTVLSLAEGLRAH